jgi:hypothetical protein
METFEQYQEKRHEHKGERHDLENATPAGEHKQGRDEGTQYKRARRLHLKP